MAQITVHRPRNYKGSYDTQGRNPGWFVSLSRSSVNLENAQHRKLFSRNAIYDSQLDRVIESYDNFRRVVEPVLNSSGFRFEGHSENVVAYESLSAVLPGPSDRQKVSGRLKGIDTDIKLPKARIIQAKEELVAISPGQHLKAVIQVLPETAGGYYNAQSEPVVLMTLPEYLSVRDQLALEGLKFADAFQTQSKKYQGLSKKQVFAKCGACPIGEMIAVPSSVRETTLLVERETGIPYRARVHAQTQPDTETNHRRNAKKPVQWTMSVLAENGWVKYTHITAQREFRPATSTEVEAFSEMVQDAVRERAEASLLELAAAGSPKNQVVHYKFVEDGSPSEGGVYAVPRSVFENVGNGKSIDISGGHLTRVGQDTIYIQALQYHEKFVPAAKAADVKLQVRTSPNSIPQKYRQTMPLNDHFLCEGSLVPGARVTYKGKEASFMGLITMQEKVAKLESPLGPREMFMELRELKKLYPELKEGQAVIIDGARYSWSVNDLNSLGKIKIRFDDGSNHIGPAERVMPNLDKPKGMAQMAEAKASDNNEFRLN